MRRSCTWLLPVLGVAAPIMLAWPGALALAQTPSNIQPHAPGSIGPTGEAIPDDFPYGPPPAPAEIPPYTEGQPLVAPGGGYCFVGSHPADARIAGEVWHETGESHTHPYAPFDLRLFSYRSGCYYFTGDPTHFGYQGDTYPYYGAHPMLESYGGGWCFMIGGHNHPWQPWSRSFVTVGSWYYWDGVYDSHFWSYYPYYSFYFRSYYGDYYGDGRFFRSRDVTVAPPINHVPRPVAPARAATATGSTVPRPMSAPRDWESGTRPHVPSRPIFPAGSVPNTPNPPRTSTLGQRVDSGWGAAPSRQISGVMAPVVPSRPSAAVPIQPTARGRSLYSPGGSDSLGGRLGGGTGGGFSGSSSVRTPTPAAPVAAQRAPTYVAPPSAMPSRGYVTPAPSGGTVRGTLIPGSVGRPRR